MSRQKLINAILKSYLWSVLLNNKPIGGNRQKNFARLVKWRKNSSDRACLNVLRAVNVRWEKLGLNIRKNNKIAGDPRIKAGGR